MPRSSAKPSFVLFFFVFFYDWGQQCWRGLTGKKCEVMPYLILKALSLIWSSDSFPSTMLIDMYFFINVTFDKSRRINSGTFWPTFICLSWNKRFKMYCLTLHNNLKRIVKATNSELKVRGLAEHHQRWTPASGDFYAFQTSGYHCQQMICKQVFKKSKFDSRLWIWSFKIEKVHMRRWNSDTAHLICVQGCTMTFLSSIWFHVKSKMTYAGENKSTEAPIQSVYTLSGKKMVL